MQNNFQKKKKKMANNRKMAHKIFLKEPQYSNKKGFLFFIAAFWLIKGLLDPPGSKLLVQPILYFQLCQLGILHLLEAFDSICIIILLGLG